jgi:hypothetical protein
MACKTVRMPLIVIAFFVAIPADDMVRMCWQFHRPRRWCRRCAKAEVFPPVVALVMVMLLVLSAMVDMDVRKAMEGMVAMMVTGTR